MTTPDDADFDPADAAANILADAIGNLENLLGELCKRLDPFPAFLGMATIQAVELEPALLPSSDHGCVVVTPDGSIAELDVTAIPGVLGVLEVDQVEEFKPIEMEPAERLIYVTCAIGTLSAELRRRGRGSTRR